MGAYLMEKHITIQIGNCKRKLPLVKGDAVSYYSFNMIGDTELNKQAAIELSKFVSDCDVIVTVESKAIALVQEISSLLSMSRYVVIRKSKKSYMTDAISVSGKTIISGGSDYYIDSTDVVYLKGKKIAVVDDVISTCGTIDSIYRLLQKCNLTINKIACVLCEGKVTKTFKDIDVLSCGFIPLLEND